jgi:hypothetical protein
MATNASYAATPVAALAQVSTVNTARDGSGTIATVLTGATNGTRVDDIILKATVTTTAGMVRFFLSLDGGTTKRLIYEVQVTANTVSSSNPAWSWVLNDLAWILPNGSAILYASTEKAEAINICVTRAGSF